MRSVDDARGDASDVSSARSNTLLVSPGPLEERKNDGERGRENERETSARGSTFADATFVSQGKGGLKGVTRETSLSRRGHVVSNPHGRQHGTTGGPYASVISSPPCRRPGYPHDGVVATRAPYPLLNNGHAPRAIRSVTHAYASGGGYSRVAAVRLGRDTR